MISNPILQNFVHRSRIIGISINMDLNGGVQRNSSASAVTSHCVSITWYNIYLLLDMKVSEVLDLNYWGEVACVAVVRYFSELVVIIFFS